MDSSANWWRPQDQVPSETGSRPEPQAASKPDGFDLAFWALIAFTLVLFLAPQENFPVLQPLRLGKLSIAVAVLAYVYNRTSRGMPLLEFSPSVVLLFLLIAWAIITLPFSMWPGGSYNELTNRFLKSAVAFLLLSHAVTSVRQLWIVAWCLSLCALPVAMKGVSNYLGGVYFHANTDRITGYDGGLTGNPNDMALMLNLMLPLTIALFLGTRSIVVRLLLGAAVSLIVAAIILTFSRAGFVMLTFIVVYYAWRVRKRRERIWIPVILVLGVLALPLVPANFYDRTSTILNYEEDETGSAQERIRDMQLATRVFLANPIKGAGIGMTTVALNEGRGEDTWKVVHNLYLQVAVSLGLPGLLFYLGFMFVCVRATGAILRRNRGDPAPPERLVLFTEGLRVSLLGFAVAVMFYPVAYNFYQFYFGGLAIAAERVLRSLETGGQA